MSSRREKSANTTYEEILREASRLFGRKGYDGTSTREIAHAVGIRQPSLFHHFDSKASMMVELLEHSLAVPSLVAERLAAAAGSPTERLYRYVLFDTYYILTSPYYLGDLAADDVIERPEFRSWGRVRQRLRNARADLIRQGIAAGEFAEVDVRLATHVLNNVIIGITFLEDERNRSAPNAVAEQVAILVTRALAADSSVIDDVRFRVREHPVLDVAGPIEAVSVDAAALNRE